MKYHPPRQSWIGERDFELYGNVVSMAYQFHDQMLGALLKKAGEDTTVILMSDHGFHPDHLRPASIPDIPAGPAIEHRDFGILAISGPGIKKDELLHGPSVLDIAPTILTLYGLPVGEDMDGKVLSQAFVKTPEIAFIPSWEEVAGRGWTASAAYAARSGGGARSAGADDRAGVYRTARMRIARWRWRRPSASCAITSARRTRTTTGTSKRTRFSRGLYAADADEQRFAVRLFVSCQALGMHEEMRRIVDDLDGRRRALFEEAKAKIEQWRAERTAAEAGRDARRRWRNLARYQPAVIDYLKAQVLTAEKRYAEALAVLERVTEAHLVRPGLFLQTADLYLRLRPLARAQEVYEKALAIDPDNAHAHIGVCRMALRRRKFSVAAHSALDALQRIHHYPLAHFLLGLALTGMQEYERAAEAFRAAISFNPNFPRSACAAGGFARKAPRRRRIRARAPAPGAPDEEPQDPRAPFPRNSGAERRR